MFYDFLEVPRVRVVADRDERRLDLKILTLLIINTNTQIHNTYNYKCVCIYIYIYIYTYTHTCINNSNHDRQSLEVLARVGGVLV